MSQAKSHKNSANLPAKPKYTDQPFSAWKAYIDDEEEPDSDFINWKKEVLGEHLSTVNKNKSKLQRIEQATGVSSRGENKVSGETTVKTEEENVVKQKVKQKEPAVLGGRENGMNF